MEVQSWALRGLGMPNKLRAVGGSVQSGYKSGNSSTQPHEDNQQWRKELHFESGKTAGKAESRHDGGLPYFR